MLLCDFTGCKVGASGVLIANMLTTATIPIVKKWKPAEIPSMNEWLSKVRYVGLMSKLTAICNYRAGHKSAVLSFYMQWESFMLSNYAGYQVTNIGIVYYWCCEKGRRRKRFGK